MALQAQKRRIYRALVYKNMDEVSKELANLSGDDVCFRLAMQTFLHSWQGEYRLAAEILEKVKTLDGNCDEWSKARVMEAEINLCIAGKQTNIKEVVSLAKEACALDSNAAIAKVYLANAYFILGKDAESEALCLEVLNMYPEAKWVYRDLVYYLLRGKKYSDAKKYIADISPKPSQLIYKLMVWVYRYKWLILAGLVACFIFFYFRTILVIHALLAIMNVSLMLYGRASRDSFIQRSFFILLKFQGLILAIYLVGMVLLEGYSIHDLFFGLY